MKLILGLGNPGPTYTFSRHNVGWRVIDAFVNNFSCPAPTNKFNGMLYGPFSLEGERVLLLKPLTFMNLSGQSAGEVCRYYDIAPSEVLAIFDDIDLPPGRLRYRVKGSAGGHNGVKSLIAHFGTDQFCRLRVGVGGKPVGGDLANHVLATPAPADREAIEEAEMAACHYAKLWLTGMSESELTTQINGFRIKPNGRA